MLIINFWILTLQKELVTILILEQYKYKCTSDFVPTKRGESHIQTINVLDSSHQIITLFKFGWYKGYSSPCRNEYKSRQYRKEDKERS